jgi:hypothetical protein
MHPIRLSDDELTAVFRAARPLAARDRDGFLQAVADALAGCAMIGPGAVDRAVRLAQKRFFDPPNLDHGDYSKYR